jgi:methyl-accepting chemotaxis protein
MRKSILKRLFASFLGFGVLTGAIFPVYAQFFVEWKPGMFAWFVIGCLVAGVTVGMANYAITKVVLLKKLQAMSHIAHAIGAGDLTQKYTIQSADVVGDMATGFNTMLQTMQNQFNDIKKSSQHLTNAARELTLITNDTKGDVSNQLQQITSLATAIEQMSASINEISHHTESAAQSAESADTIAQQGNRVANEAQSVIQSLLEKLEETANNVEQVQQRSQNIGKVIEVIHGIAEQTNLLALNAAIESARAGEQGRGFSVVADEVRSLAGRTQESTQQIQQIIQELQQGSNKAFETMQDAKSSAQEGFSEVVETATSLSEIANTIADISKMNFQVASALNQQKQTAQEISKSFTMLRSLAENTNLLTHKTADTSKELETLASSLNHSTSGLKSA